ncbi:MAG: HDOD domain-containing protein [Ruminococcus sp.]|nr:HDOD domain-containing protein [Ruminococcus sp.]
MFPSREEAHRLIEDAEKFNPGPWVEHSKAVASCAESIASNCVDLDAEKAYILGLLHDIGRKFGVKHLAHVYDGYTYMNESGYDEVARICMTHSFCVRKIDSYVGKFDVSDDIQKFIEDYLVKVKYDDYDRLIQLCDALGSAEGVVSVECRMADVKQRYGYYPQDKWDKHIELKEYFSEKIGRNIYEIFCEKDLLTEEGGTA